MSGRMSREKGKRGEREWAKVCRDHGYDCRRTSQYCGQSGDASDVVGLYGVHQEVKRTESLRLYEAMGQAVRDAKPEEKPIIAHRRNDCEWLVVMRAKDWFDLYRAWEAQETTEGD